MVKRAVLSARTFINSLLASLSLRCPEAPSKLIPENLIVQLLVSAISQELMRVYVSDSVSQRLTRVAAVQTEEDLLLGLHKQSSQTLISRVQVREEALSEDDQSGQLKNITIRLGGSSPSLVSDCSDYFM